MCLRRVSVHKIQINKHYSKNVFTSLFHFSLLLQLHIHPQSGCELSSPQKDGTGEVTPFLWLEEGDEMLNRMPMSMSKLHRDSPVIKSVLIAEF